VGFEMKHYLQYENQDKLTSTRYTAASRKMKEMKPVSHGTQHTQLSGSFFYKIDTRCGSVSFGENGFSLTRLLPTQQCCMGKGRSLQTSLHHLSSLVLK